MKVPFLGLMTEWKDLERFKSLEPSDRSIVFYGEDSGSWPHFEHVISELTERLGRKICYVTSSKEDPVLNLSDERVLTFFVGFGPARTALFRNLQAGVMVMTMPDLHNYHVKRSRSPVHYVYLHHSMVSTHMIYRAAAFDNFDTIFCVGPHHKSETAKREALHGLTPKNLVLHGYGRLDSLLKASPSNDGGTLADQGSRPRVLIAPSWGKEALLEVCGTRLVEVLVVAGYQVTIRAHPMTVRKSPRVMADLKKRFGNHPLITLETDMSSEESLRSSDVMISDWSGAAFEFAFGLERPVLFIDVPRKVLNPGYEELSLIPVEVALRAEMGAVISANALEEVPAQIRLLCGDRDGYLERIRELREKWIYNVGSSGSVGAEYIAQAADRAMSTLS